MNSFNTHEDTIKVVQKYGSNQVTVHNFNQSRFPRIYKDTLVPVPEDFNDQKDAWYPPGHGDVFESFDRSGLLDRMISEGKEYVFISNVDNLGATADFSNSPLVFFTKVNSIFYFSRYFEICNG